MLNFVICDDNLNIVNKLKEMLEIIFVKNDIDAQVSFISDNAKDTLEFVNNNHIDVAILDVNLNSNMSGIDLAQEIRKNNKNIYLIFSTGHLEYSLIAYTVKTFDYLPKPITIERLEITINRLLDDMGSSNKKYIHIDKKTIINPEEINFIKKDGMKLVFCTDSQDFEVYNSFNKIKNLLPDNFVRCHKSYIANTANIININTKKNIINFDNNLSCEIGPKYKNNLMEVFNYGNVTNNMDSNDNRE